jgi:hypothetical protein
MFEKTQLEVFDEAVKPHLGTDEGQKFLAGRARLEEVRVRPFINHSIN